MFQLLLLLFLVSFGSKNILIALLDSKHIWANVTMTTTHPVQHYSLFRKKGMCISVPIIPSKLLQQIKQPLAGPSSF